MDIMISALRRQRLKDPELKPSRSCTTVRCYHNSKMNSLEIKSVVRAMVLKVPAALWHQPLLQCVRSADHLPQNN